MAMGPRPSLIGHSADEFDNVIEMYDMIESGSGCIDLQGLSPEDRKAAMEPFVEILRTGVGRELIGELLQNENGRRFTYEQTQGRPGASFMDVAAATGASPGGADSRLTLDPRQAQPWTGKGHAPDWYPISADTALFHELVHGLHHVSGDTLYDRGDASKSRFHDEEERATGVGDFEGERFSERTYRGERRALGEHAPDREWYWTPK